MNIPEGNPGLNLPELPADIFHQAPDCLRGVSLRHWLRLCSRLTCWTVETLFLTLDQSPRRQSWPLSLPPTPSRATKFTIQTYWSLKPHYRRLYNPEPFEGWKKKKKDCREPDRFWSARRALLHLCRRWHWLPLCRLIRKKSISAFYVGTMKFYRVTFQLLPRGNKCSILQIWIMTPSPPFLFL